MHTIPLNTLWRFITIMAYDLCIRPKGILYSVFCYWVRCFSAVRFSFALREYILADRNRLFLPNGEIKARFFLSLIFRGYCFSWTQFVMYPDEQERWKGLRRPAINYDGLVCFYLHFVGWIETLRWLHVLVSYVYFTRWQHPLVTRETQILLNIFNNFDIWYFQSINHWINCGNVSIILFICVYHANSRYAST